MHLLFFSSCNDLLNGVQPLPKRHRDASLCWTCSSTHRNPVPRHGGRCLSCLEPANPRSSYATFLNTIHDYPRYEMEYFPRRSSQTSTTSSNYQPTSVSTPVSSTSSQAMPHTELPIKANESMGYHPSVYLQHPPSPSASTPSQATYANTSPTLYSDHYASDMRHTNQMSSYVPSDMLWTPNSTRDCIPSQSTKAAATNARHKDSEKKRRDITVSCVAAIEIFTRDIHPGVATGCQVCIEDETARKPLPAFDGTYNVDKSKDADGLLNRMKRPKNDKLEEGCMFQYLYVLHHHPEVYPQRVEELVELMKEQKKEQERGAKEAGNSEAKLRKWQGDQRAAQTEKLLRQAKELGRRHGLLMDGGAAVEVKREKKRKSSEEHANQQKRHISAPTPPSSISSPRSRRAWPDSGDEGYVAV